MIASRYIGVRGNRIGWRIPVTQYVLRDAWQRFGLEKLFAEMLHTVCERGPWEVQPLLEMPLQVVGQRAEENVTSDSIIQAVR